MLKGSTCHTGLQRVQGAKDLAASPVLPQVTVADYLCLYWEPQSHGNNMSLVQDCMTFRVSQTCTKHATAIVIVEENRDLSPLIRQNEH